jgi:hypothetical protein
MVTAVNRKVLTRWDELIHDANRQIDTAKERIAKLKRTVKSLERLRDSGQPWPGTQLEVRPKRQQPSV